MVMRKMSKIKLAASIVCVLASSSAVVSAQEQIVFSAKAANAPTSNFHANFKGELVFASDNAIYTAAGFEWPWENTLNFASSNLPSAQTYEITAARGDFVYSPQWLKENILFKAGDPNSSYGTYQLIDWNRTKGEFVTVAKNLSWRLVLTSSSERYVSYIKGAQPIPLRGGVTKASLRTFDLQTQEEKRWGDGEPLLGHSSWSPDDKLLFSLARDSAEEKERSNQAKADPNFVWRPSIYEADPATGNTKVLVRDAVRAKVSPDDQWMAFVSFNNPLILEDKKQIQPDPTLPSSKSSTFLVIARRDGSQPQLVSTSIRNGFSLLWAPDSQSFFVCDTRYAGTAKGKKNSMQVTVSQYVLSTKEFKRVATLSYTAYPGTDLSEDDRLWRPIQITKDGRYLVSELLQLGPWSLPENGLFLKAVNLSTGEVETWAKVKSVRGLDWREY